METSPSLSKYVSTGIPGLDRVLYGGFLREGFYLLQGDPGSGKTTVALQYLLSCSSGPGDCLYITLTETRRDLERAAISHGWDISGLGILDLTRSVANRSVVSEYSVFMPSHVELGQIVETILTEVQRVRPQHVVFDGLSEMRLLAGDPYKYRRQMLALKDFFEDNGITALLLDDRTNPFGEIQPESLVGGNIVMERFLPGYGGARRRIYVTKVRGADFRDGFHDYEITHGGVVVHPRLVAAEHHERFELEEIKSGVQGLDELFCGGIQLGSTTLLLGPAGVGKSTVAMQYVSAALESGRSAAVYTFDEVLESLFRRSEKLCHGGIRGYAESGQLLARQVDPAEMSPGAFAHAIRQAVEERGCDIVVIDSLNGYLNAMPDEKFLATHLHELFSYLNQQGILTIVVISQHGVMRGETEMDVSYLADSVLLFRYFEADSEIRQAVSVFKKRTGPHERALRELRIGSEGVYVGAPLRQFHGILTGVPQYTSTVRDSGELQGE